MDVSRSVVVLCRLAVVHTGSTTWITIRLEIFKFLLDGADFGTEFRQILASQLHLGRIWQWGLALLN